MHQEIEVKFLQVDHDQVRTTLQKIGAHCKQPARLMRRCLLDFPDGTLAARRSRLRVRDEGNKVTITAKMGHVGDYADEIEITVGSYETMIELLTTTLGLKVLSYQENRRETWEYQGVEIMLDEWPWIDPYIEIEGSSEAAIQDCAKRLGFQWEDAFKGVVDVAYKRQYPKMTEDETITSIAQIVFDEPLPAWLAERQA